MANQSFQDMPPPGGFGFINVGRTLPKPMLRQGILFAILMGLTVNSAFVFPEYRKRQYAWKTEEYEHYVAVSPFIEAERERNFLKHLYNQREYERFLMKDVPGWKTGTLFGEKLYKALPEDSIPPIQTHDMYVHRTEDEWHQRVVKPTNHT